MNRRIPAVLLLVMIVGGCATKPVTTTETHPATTNRMVYDDYVARRTYELQRMGGPFAKREDAESRARDEATSRYGTPPPDVSTTWSWGAQAGRKHTQAQVQDTLEKMDRDALRR